MNSVFCAASAICADSTFCAASAFHAESMFHYKILCDFMKKHADSTICADSTFCADSALLKNSSSLSSQSPALRGSSALLTLLVSFLKIACLHVSFTAYENFYKLSKMHCLLVLTFHFSIFRMSECRNPTIKHIFTYTLISPFIGTYVTDLFLVIFFT